MSRYTAPLGFTLVAIWVVVIFAIVAGQHAPNGHGADQTTGTQTAQHNAAPH